MVCSLIYVTFIHLRHLDREFDFSEIVWEIPPSRAHAHQVNVLPFLCFFFLLFFLFINFCFAQIAIYFQQLVIVFIVRASMRYWF